MKTMRAKRNNLKGYGEYMLPSFLGKRETAEQARLFSSRLCATVSFVVQESVA